MVWKQDLAKLKAQLREEPAPPPKKVAPKPLEATPRSMEDEDALFLAMMGRRAPERPAPVPAERGPGPAVLPPPPAPAGTDFQEALSGLKGMKRLEADPLLAAAAQAPVPPPAPEPPVAPPGAEPQSAPGEPIAAAPEVPPAEGLRPGVPQRIQLAAGMAIEVDGSLDLRGHSLQDALERIKDRVADAHYLRWRSLLVHLGPGTDLHEGFLAMVAAGGVPGVTRFAQAPVPMGGTQAWVLYLLP